MLIRRIAVRNFRKLLHGVEIDGMEPGLTVIVGDNEEGKSTLLKALQSAFFDRYKLTGDAADAMKPFGSEVRPEVAVDFEVGQTSYRLKKGFLQSSSALLESDRDRWQNDSAEDQLRGLLGFSSPGRGAAKEEHRGLSGLLWVEQGRAFEPLELNRDTRDALHEAIKGEVGQVTGGERGRKLLAVVHEKCNEYFSPKKGDEKGELKAARSKVEDLNGKVQRIEIELAQYNDKVDTLANLKNILTRYESEGRLAQAQAEMQEAQNTARELEAVDAQIETAEARLKEAKTAFEFARAAWRTRKDKVERLQSVETEAEPVTRNVENLNEELRLATEARDRAEDRLRVTNAALENAESNRIAAERERKRAEITVSLEELDGRIQRARDIQTKTARDRETAAGIPIDKATLARLQEKDQELENKRAALEAVATTLDFSPSGDQSVNVDGQTWDAGRQRRITEKTTLELEGFGLLLITPGGEDIRARRAAVEELQSSAAADLQRVGCDSVEAAETAWSEKNALQSRIGQAQARLDEIVPEGLEELQTRADGLRERLGAVKALIADPSSPPSTVREAKEVEEAASSQEEDARAAQTAAGEQLKAEERNFSDVQERRTGETSTLAQLEKQIKRLRKDLDNSRQDKADVDLERDVDAAGKTYDTRATELEKLETQRERMSPDLVQAELARSQDAYENLQKQIAKDKEQADKLEGELRGIGQKGLGEAAQQKRGELEIATQDLARLELDAKAWKLLRDTLQQAEREAKEKFLAPVTERLQPYMKLVFPGTDLQLDEEKMEIAALRRVHKEPFVSLSIGTQEQIAVLARLALADLLREKGKPVVLILDDALVNCDDGRFNRMALALRKAADNVQIIILTCHEARYRSLGVTMVRLMDCQADAA